jgi:hypothetical protein
MTGGLENIVLLLFFLLSDSPVDNVYQVELKVVPASSVALGRTTRAIWFTRVMVL